VRDRVCCCWRLQSAGAGGMPVGGCPCWDGFVRLFFGDCESGSGALLGAQDISDGSLGRCVFVTRWVRGADLEVSVVLAGMGV